MKISQEKKNKISEQIIHFLYSNSPSSLFTSHIAKEIARDEEFVKKILTDLKKKGIVNEIKKNSKGIEFSRRQRWALTEAAYSAMSNHN